MPMPRVRVAASVIVTWPRGPARAPGFCRVAGPGGQRHPRPERDPRSGRRCNGEGSKRACRRIPRRVQAGHSV